MKGLIRLSIFICLTCVLSVNLSAQSDKLKKANKYYELNAFNSAIENYQQVLKMDASNPEALSKIADSYRLVNQMDKAVEHYSALMSGGIFESIDLLRYGLALKGEAKYKDAKKWFLEYAKSDKLTGEHFAASCDYAMANLENLAEFKVINAATNTPYSEFSPAFYNGKLVYSSSSPSSSIENKGPSTNWAGDAFNKLYVAYPDAKAVFKNVQILKTGIKAKFNEGPLVFSSNGRTVYYTRNDFVNGIRPIPESGIQLSLYSAKVESGNSWKEPTAFSFNNMSYSVGYPALSSDSRTLYFSSDMPGGFGGFDLYKVTYNGSKWSAPVNLGNKVNTKGDEISPYLDKNVLYFSSNWHKGLGGFDVFKASNEAGKWTNIMNVGRFVNSPKDDISFIYDSVKDQGYLTSNRKGGKGLEDIYGVNRADQDIEIVVIDAANGKGLNGASVDFSNCGKAKYTTNANGKFAFEVLSGLECKLIIAKNGYYSKDFSFSTTDKQKQVLEIALEAVKKETPKIVGTVRSSDSKALISNVIVKAKNKKTGDQLALMTDDKGRYELPLLDGALYLITFSKAGFEDQSQEFKIADNMDMIEMVSLEPSATTITNIKPGKNNVVASNPGKKQPAKVGPGKTQSFAITKAYEIQVGRYAKPNREKLNVLNEYGLLFEVPEGNQTIFRLGTYSSREVAEEVQAKIEQSHNFKGTYIREISGDELPEKIFTDITKAILVSGSQPKSDLPAAKPDKPEAVEALPRAELVYFKVQLGVFKNPNNAQFTQVEKLGIGSIERQATGNNLTIFLLGDYLSLEDARAAKIKAEATGEVTSPFIVGYKNGKKVKLSEIVNKENK